MKSFWLVFVYYRMWDVELDDYGEIAEHTDDVWARDEAHALRLALSDFLADPPGVIRTIGTRVEPLEAIEALAARAGLPAYGQAQ